MKDQPRAEKTESRGQKLHSQVLKMMQRTAVYQSTVQQTSGRQNSVQQTTVYQARSGAMSIGLATNRPPDGRILVKVQAIIARSITKVHNFSLKSTLP